MTQVTMPRLSDTMEEGTISQWLKQVGDEVHRGDTLAEIETDKATMELESYDEGVLQQILVEAGATVPIGEPIAVIGSGEAAPPAAEAAPAETATSAGAAEAEAAPAGTGGPEAGGRERGGEAVPAETQQAPAATEPRGDGQIRTSPLARAIARKAGLDLSTVKGTGPGGRIIRADVEAAVSAMEARAGEGPPVSPVEAAAPAAKAAPAAPAAARPAGAEAAPEEIKLTNVRRVTARRLVESIQETPHFYLTSVVDAEALLTFRKEANERLASVDMKISVNDLILKACAVALRLHPNVNASWGGDKILRHRQVNVGMAVAVPDGLVVPVIHDADKMSVGEISERSGNLAEKARAGKLSLPEMQGGTFTVSNLGMYGVDHFTAVINPPEAAILAVGAAQPEAVVRDGQVVARNTMKITLSIDHRVLDGATAAEFLRTLHGILEEPLRIVM